MPPPVEGVVPLVGVEHTSGLGLGQRLGVTLGLVDVVVGFLKGTPGTLCSSTPQSRSMSVFSWFWVSDMKITVR